MKINILLLPFQNQVLETIMKDPDNKKQVLLIGNRGCGKTYIALTYAATSILSPNRNIGFIVGRDNPKDVDQEFQKLLSQIRKLKIVGSTPLIMNKTSSTPHLRIYEYNNGSSIFFISASHQYQILKQNLENLNKRQGQKFDKLIFDDFDIISDLYPSETEL